MLPRCPNGPAVEWQLGSEHWLTHCLLGGRRPDRGAPRAQEAKPVIIGEWLREREGSLFLPDDRPGLIGRPLFYRLNSTTEAGYSHRGPASAPCPLPPSCPPPSPSPILRTPPPSSPLLQQPTLGLPPLCSLLWCPLPTRTPDRFHRIPPSVHPPSPVISKHERPHLPGPDIRNRTGSLPSHALAAGNRGPA